MSTLFQLLQTDDYTRWSEALRDMHAADRIAARLRRVEHGNFGDHKSLGGGLAELRLDIGPGYRIYFTVRGREIVLLLAGGTKASQSRDIARARLILADEPDGS